jgi:ornithine cyclodeaminase
MKIRILSAEDIRRLLPMAETIEVVKDAFVQLSEKKAQAPVRTSLKISPGGDAALIMPAFLEKSRALGAKLVTVFPANPQKGLPSTQALIFLMSAETGVPLAIFEGTYLTRLRTGAASGAATQMLSRADSEILAIFGAGGQALLQVLGVLAVRKIREIRIFDLIARQGEILKEELRSHPDLGEIKILRANSAEEAVAKADILVTATTSHSPVFPGKLLSPGTHINAIGAFTPEMQEVDEETILRSRIFVDSLITCLEEGGDIIVPLSKGLICREDIQGELGEVVSGKKEGRKTREEITYFKSVGNAVQDISVAQAVFRRAMEKKVGSEIGL